MYRDFSDYLFYTLDSIKLNQEMLVFKNQGYENLCICLLAIYNTNRRDTKFDTSIL